MKTTQACCGTGEIEYGPFLVTYQAMPEVIDDSVRYVIETSLEWKDIEKSDIEKAPLYARHGLGTFLSFYAKKYQDQIEQACLSHHIQELENPIYD